MNHLVGHCQQNECAAAAHNKHRDGDENDQHKIIFARWEHWYMQISAQYY